MPTSNSTSSNQDDDWSEFADFYTGNVTRYTLLFANDLLAGTLHDAIANATTILDIGCGPGVVVQAYLNHFPSGIAGQTILCTDVSPEMIAKCQQVLEPKLPDGFKTRIKYQVEDGADLQGIADGSVSVVVSNFALDHIPDRKQAVQEIWRVLAPGGRFGSTAWTKLQCHHALEQEGYGPAFYDVVNATWDALGDVSADEDDDSMNAAASDNATMPTDAPSPHSEKVFATAFHSVSKYRSIHTVTWPQPVALWNMICASLGTRLSSYEPVYIERAKQRMMQMVHRKKGQQDETANLWLVAKIVVATK